MYRVRLIPFEFGEYSPGKSRQFYIDDTSCLDVDKLQLPESEHARPLAEAIEQVCATYQVTDMVYLMPQTRNERAETIEQVASLLSRSQSILLRDKSLQHGFCLSIRKVSEHLASHIEMVRESEGIEAANCITNVIEDTPELCGPTKHIKSHP